MRWRRRESVAVKDWVAVDRSRRLVASADSLDELLGLSVVNQEQHSVHERDRDGKWWELTAAYEPARPGRPHRTKYVGPHATALEKTVARGER